MKLTICIPTMNRAKFIGETLDSIIQQVNDETEIVIVDGGSTDNTDEIVASYSRNFPRLRYVRSPNSSAQPGVPSNAGFDLDCSHAVEISLGEYCWLMTDDDLMLPGALAAVFEKMNAGPGLIIVDAEVRNQDFSRVIHERRLSLQADRAYAAREFENFFVDVADHLTFVGGIIIKRSAWLDRDRKTYVGTGFIHVGVIFQRAFADGVVVIARPLIRIRFGNALWSSRAFTIWNVSWPALIWSFGFSDVAKRKVVPSEPWRNIRKLVGFRIMGAYSIKEYRAVIAPRLKSRWSFIPGFLVSRTPVMSLKAFAAVRRFVRTGSWQ